MLEDYYKWPGETDDLIVISEYRSSAPVKTHKHDFIEIVIVLKGTCVHHYLSNTTRLTEGDVFIVAPHEEHSYEISEEVIISNCLLYPDILGDEWAEFKQMSGLYNFIMLEPFFRFETDKQEILHFSQDELIHIKHFLDEIKSEQKNKHKGYRVVQKANFMALLAYIGRKWEYCFDKMDSVYSHKRILVEDAIAYIALNIQENLSIDKIAQKVFLSPDYFRRLFKDATGMSPIKYMNNLRISKAEALLKDTNLTVGEIAQAVGIYDANYFSKLFHSFFQCTPTEYRKKTEFYD